jgi:hypothetical protein
MLSMVMLTTGCSQLTLKDEVKPPLPDPEPTTAEEYCERGTILYHDARYDEAIEDFTRALEHDPANIEAYIGRSKTYPHLNEWDKALADCTRVIEMGTRSPTPYYIRALIHINNKKYGKAIDDFNKAIFLEDSEEKSDDLINLNKLIDLVVAPDELILLDALWSSQRTGICNPSICSAPIAYNIAFKVHVFVNPVQSITITGINVSPAIGDISQIKVKRKFSTPGFQTIMTNSSSQSPVPSTGVNCYVSYQSGEQSVNRKSNIY